MNKAIRMFILLIAMFVCLCLGMADCAVAVAATTEAGVVAKMEGSLSAKGADGALRALSIGGKVFAGDMLFTSKDSFARIKFADGGEMSLKPHAQFQIESFHFDEKEPNKDSAVFTLVKGGMRAISGLIGKRGDPDNYGVKTRVATIGIRGTDYGVLLCKGDCADIPTPDGLPLEDGLHVDVLHGTVLVKNSAGSQLLHPGEFSYVRDSSVAPAVVPPGRGISVEIPARITEDKVRGGSDGKNKENGGVEVPTPPPTPNVCPAP